MTRGPRRTRRTPTSRCARGSRRSRALRARRAAVGTGGSRGVRHALFERRAGEGALAPMPSRGSVRLGSATASRPSGERGVARVVARRSSVLRETRTCSSVRRERGDSRQSPRGRAQWPREGAETANYITCARKVLTTAPRSNRTRARGPADSFRHWAADAGPLTRRSWVQTSHSSRSARERLRTFDSDRGGRKP